MSSNNTQTGNNPTGTNPAGENTATSSKVDVGKLMQGIGGLGSAAATAYSTYANVQGVDNIINQANAARLNSSVGTNSFDDWTQAYLNNRAMEGIGLKDVGFNSGKAKLNVASTALQGAAAGAVLGPWGAVGGALVGLAGGLFGYNAAKKKAEKNARLGNSAIVEANAYNSALLNNNLMNLKDRQYNDLAASYIAAEGGMLQTQGSEWNTGLNYIGAGGSHEQNPNGGVQMGIAPDGQPNLVEEGEVIWNDYVFSNRLKTPKKFADKYKLGGTMTFAEAAKHFSEEIEERPNDPISKRGLVASLSKLMLEQEIMRQKKGIEAMFSNGGTIHIDKNKRGTFTAAASKHGKSVQEFASQVLANPDNYSPAMRKKANFARNAAKWHSNGGHLYLDGSFIPNEWGILDKVPLLMLSNPDLYRTFYSTASNGPDKQGRNPLNRKWQIPLENDTWRTALSNNYITPADELSTSKGVTLSPYGYHELPGTKFNAVKSNEYKEALERALLPSAIDSFVNPNLRKLTLDTSVTEPTVSAPIIPDVNNPSGRNSWLTGLRYAPVVGSALGVFSDLMGWTNKPDYSSADAILEASKGVRDVSFRPIGDYLAYTPFDRMFYLNQLNANAGATRRATLNTAAGNRGTAMAGILAADNNMMNSIGQLARQAEEYNLAQRQKVAEFNRATNMFNSEGFLKAQQANQGASEVRMRAAQAAAAMRDAIDQRVGAAKSLNLTNLFNNLGDIGWEEFNRNMINSSPYLDYLMSRTGNLGYKGKSKSKGGYITIKNKRRRK